MPAPTRAALTAEVHGGTGPHAPRRKLRTTILPARLPHAIQLCIHCRERPAGFWVSRTGGQTVRRPWCLSCCEELGRDHCDPPDTVVIEAVQRQTTTAMGRDTSGSFRLGLVAVRSSRDWRIAHIQLSGPLGTTWTAAPCSGSGWTPGATS